MRPRHIVGVLLGLVLAALVGAGIYFHLAHGSNQSTRSGPSTIVALDKNCTKGRVINYPDSAPKGSYQFAADYTGHALKPVTKRTVTMLCHSPSFAAAVVDFTKTGKLRPSQVNALARHYLRDRKLWHRDLLALFDKGNANSKAKIPATAVTRITVMYERNSYDTEGAVPHGKRLPTIKRYAISHSAGWVVVFHLKNGQVREFRIKCGDQPVVPHKHAATAVAARSSSGSTPHVVTTVYRQPPPGSTPPGKHHHRTPPPPHHRHHKVPPPPHHRRHHPPPPHKGCAAGTHPSPVNGTCIKSKDPSKDPLRNPSVPPIVKGQGTTPVGSSPGPATQPIDSPTGSSSSSSSTVTTVASVGDSGPGATNVTTPPATSQPPVAPPVTSAPGSGASGSSGSSTGGSSSTTGVALH